MKLNLILIMLFISELCYSQNDTIFIDVVVSSNDKTIRNIILSQLQSELSNKRQVVVNKIKPEYNINVQCVDIKNDDKIIGVTISTILTKQVKGEAGQIINEILTSIVSNVDKDSQKIKSKCIDIVSTLDVEYFEKER